jgi:SpoVK/Ycf46/Vps4 family AAA+-type ATPase
MKRKLQLQYINHIDDNGVIHIVKSINNLKDLIDLCDMYVPGYDYNINMERLFAIKEPLITLNESIGLENTKSEIIKQILFFLQDFQGTNGDMLHTVIQGPPGCGKTMLGEIIGEIYYKMGVIKNDDEINFEYKFKIIKRTDLIGQYLGTTAKKTQEAINSCFGGVMFIDEAYSLGNEEKKDIYAKECIDTINQNLTEHKGEFLCIVAGYECDLDKCFFAYNEGLRRRFPFVYTIDKYTHDDLRRIFCKMISKSNWEISIDIKTLKALFEDNYDAFTNMAGDMETLVFNCKLEHSTRVFCLDDSYKNKISSSDLVCAIQVLKKNRKIVNIVTERDEYAMRTMYS